MSSRPESPSSTGASDSEPPTNPTSSFPTPSGSPRNIHRVYLKSRDIPTNSGSPTPAQTSTTFTRDVNATINAHNERWARKPRSSSSSLNAQNEETIKEATSTVHSRAGPGPRGWEVLPTPTPREKDSFLGDVAYEIKKLHNLRDGLQSYLDVIHSEVHQTFSQSFSNSQTEQVASLQEQISSLIPQFETVQTRVKSVPLIPIASHPEHTDYFSLTVQGRISTGTEKEYDALKAEAHKIRKFFMDAHVWYKINYALVAKKDVDVAVKVDAAEEKNKK